MAYTQHKISYTRHVAGFSPEDFLGFNVTPGLFF